MGELGDVVSCLFPTTATLYRRSGYEIGGVQTRTTYAAHLLRDLGASRTGQGGSGGLRPATRADAQRMHELARDASARHGVSGPMVPSVEALEGTLEQDELIAYAVDGGFVVYDLSEQAVTVENLVATTPEAAATLWGVVGSGSSAAPTVHTYLDPRDPVTLVLGGLPATEVRQIPWMGRVVDLAAAFGGRGFGPHTLGRGGPPRRGCRGPGELRPVDAGGVSRPRHRHPQPTTRPGRGVLRVEARGLSALWCGWSVSRLRQAGLATGGTPEGDAALDAVFACQPFITEYF